MIHFQYFLGGGGRRSHIVTSNNVAAPKAKRYATNTTGGKKKLASFMGVNAAHPLENPTPFTNLLEMLSILLIPAALCFTFGYSVKNKKQGIAIFAAMVICLIMRQNVGVWM